MAESKRNEETTKRMSLEVHKPVNGSVKNRGKHDNRCSSKVYLFIYECTERERERERERNQVNALETIFSLSF